MRIVELIRLLQFFCESSHCSPYHPAAVVEHVQEKEKKGRRDVSVCVLWARSRQVSKLVVKVPLSKKSKLGSDQLNIPRTDNRTGSKITDQLLIYQGFIFNLFLKKKSRKEFEMYLTLLNP